MSMPPPKPAAPPGVIPLHGEEGFAGMRKAGQLTAEALDILAEYVEPGRDHRRARQARL